MRIYLAGPMRGLPEFNFPAFDKGARKLRTYGHTVFNPAEHDRETHGDDFQAKAPTGTEQVEGFSLRDALGADLHYITQCADAVAVLPGWESSKGARAEVATALALGLHVSPVLGFRRADYGGNIIRKGGAITTVPVEAQTATDDERVVPSLGEVRAVSSTGGEKGVKPARMSLLPAYPLSVVAEHYGKGASKYSAHNWRKGYEFSKSSDALLRHIFAWLDGEDNDPELGTSHLAAVVFHAFTLIQGMRDWPHFDDRYKPADVSLNRLRDLFKNAS